MNPTAVEHAMTNPARRDPSAILANVKARLLDRGCRLKDDKPDGLRAICPAHSDEQPSLLARCKPNGLQVKCFARCTTGAIAHALGMHPRDFFVDSPTPHTRRMPIATYEYSDRDGKLVARTTRFDDKTFAWQHPDLDARDGWSKGFGAVPPRLYRWPTLIGAPVVWLCEGEKAVDLLTKRGFVATCGTAGASTWKETWSTNLIEAGCRELLILLDHDVPGARHAERVATDVRQHDASIVIKLIDLPGLPPRGDVADFLEAGHTRDELLVIAASTRPWALGAIERRRAEHHRERTKASMRALRAQRRGDTQATPSNSRNTNWRALKGGLHSRTMIGRALEHGATTDVLISEGGGQQGRGNIYRLALTHRAIESGKSGTNPTLSRDSEFCRLHADGKVMKSAKEVETGGG